MTFFCKVCSTESEVPTLCSGCGGLMTALTGNHKYVVEIVDQIASKRSGQPVLFERRGPFDSVTEADNWWHRHESLPKYMGCEAYTAILESTGEQYD